MLPFFTATDDQAIEAVSPLMEMGAYEYLWKHPVDGSRTPSFKTIAEIFEKSPGALPSDLVDRSEAIAYGEQVMEHFEKRKIGPVGIRLHGIADYPDVLRDAQHPVEFLYYRGWWDLVYQPKRIAIVGTRKPSDEGVRRTRKLVRKLVRENYVIVSGLAAGVDTAAHEATLDCGGSTIAVIGTSISETYPKENRSLQNTLARDHLVISQIPVLRYASQTFSGNRLFFPERNITMSALTQATVIVEAGPTSGTLIQARAAINQGRKLFILDSNFGKPGITWPERFVERGAVRVKDFDDILSNLDAQTSED